MKCKLIFLSIITCTLIACSKLNPDATDTTLTEGRWRVESIRYTGVRPDGTSVSGEDNSQAAIFFAGDILEFKDGKIFQGEYGSQFYSIFITYQGSIRYSIIDQKLHIPKQVFQAGSEDAGGGWSVTLECQVGEYTLPYSLTEDTWTIRHEDRQRFDLSTLEYWDCDYEYILKRVN